ncbi:hypothetical protein AX16_002289 [Volvariella volvacea WC 439]|nr:hypothetical protein AX16_002289 [Volvariella volvacea WC 439]
MSNPIDLNNIQGDILLGLPKRAESFLFLEIADPTAFRQHLKVFLTSKLVHSVADLQVKRDEIRKYHRAHPDGTLLRFAGAAIGFSHAGFQALGIDDTGLTHGSPAFAQGQEAVAVSILGDTPNPNDPSEPEDWASPFTTKIHAVIAVAVHSTDIIQEIIDQIILTIFGYNTPQSSINLLGRLDGKVRPPPFKGHEHFGFQDGISNPTVVGFNEPTTPGVPQSVNPGVLVTGYEGDPNLNDSTRVAWQKDGSFMAFRQFRQFVPEFNQFLAQHPVQPPPEAGSTLTPEQGSQLLGARMVGRWPSGTPVMLSPWEDTNPPLNNNHDRANDFDYTAPDSSTLCPFSAHIRKMFPRPNDLTASFNDVHRMMRQGIPYGEEVTPEENAQNKTLLNRGLLFVGYQSLVENGFDFQINKWANAPGFRVTNTGLDPLIGQGPDHFFTGGDPNNPGLQFDFTPFAVPLGGEYFFMPSISALNDTIASGSSY